MPIPSYETMMKPLLEYLSDKKEHKLNELIEHIYETFNLTEKREKRTPPKWN